MNLVTTQDLALGALTDAVAGTLAGCECHLYKNDITPTPGTPLGSYTEADFSGYAAGAITWLAPTVNDAGEVEVIGTVPEFRPTSDTVQNQIYGATIQDGGGTILYAASRFDNPPVPMVGTLDSILLTIRLRFSPGGLIVAVT
jgi:hypothetical protein